jgi:hypothetical protein
LTSASSSFPSIQLRHYKYGFQPTSIQHPSPTGEA